jgi:membrane-bound metal-dependent hydrolase YbcI (DUF457 family)
MHIPTHLMASWVVGHRLSERRDRVLVAWAGVSADLDGLTILAGPDVYGRWHHALTHGLVAGLLMALLVGWWAKNPFAVWALALTAFHLHVVCDFLGSGVEWPIQYFWPISDTFYHTSYGWELDAWENWATGVLLILLCGRLAVTSGRSFAETFHTKRADALVVLALRQRFAPKRADPATPFSYSTQP